MQNKYVRRYLPISVSLMHQGGCLRMKSRQVPSAVCWSSNEPAPLAISAVHPADRRVPTKVRVFTEFVMEALRGNLDLQTQDRNVRDGIPQRRAVPSDRWLTVDDFGGNPPDGRLKKRPSRWAAPTRLCRVPVVLPLEIATFR